MSGAQFGVLGAAGGGQVDDHVQILAVHGFLDGLESVDEELGLHGGSAGLVIVGVQVDHGSAGLNAADGILSHFLGGDGDVGGQVLGAGGTGQRDRNCNFLVHN